MTRTSLALLIVTAACTSDPATTVTDYAVTVTPGNNGCLLASWSGSATSAPFELTQTGAQGQVVVGGTPGAFLRGVVGDDVLAGTSDGGTLDMELVGTVQQMMTYCSFTLDAHLTGTLAPAGSATTLTGSLVLTTANRGPDCGGFGGTVPPDGCTSTSTIAP